LELDVFPRELANGPKVPQGRCIALGTKGTSRNHVCLAEFGPICPKQYISFVNLGCHGKTWFFKECGDIVLGKIGFLGNLCPFASSNNISLGNLGIFALRNHVFQLICPMKHMF
jgi:hypothetical protein